MENTQRKTKHPELQRRIVGTFIDGAVAFLLLVSLGSVLDVLEIEVPFARLGTIIVAASYEPLLSVFGCTLGKWFVGMRIRNYDTGKPPSVYESYLRYFFKVVIGWKSLLFYSTVYERLIHDRISDTMVVVHHKQP